VPTNLNLRFSLLVYLSFTHYPRPLPTSSPITNRPSKSPAQSITSMMPQRRTLKLLVRFLFKSSNIVAILIMSYLIARSPTNYILPLYPDKHPGWMNCESLISITKHISWDAARDRYNMCVGRTIAPLSQCAGLA
jgi:hypothetical protein